MRHLKWKKKRPTIETARAYLRDGHHTVDPRSDYQSPDEQRAEMEAIVADLESTYTRFPRTTSLEYAVLKGHLILEHAVMQYIRYHARLALDIEDLRFTFAQKVDIACLMGFGLVSPTLLATIKLFNKARNEVAHTFSLSRETVDELIRFNSDEEPVVPLTDRQRIAALRRICAFICGKTAGVIEADFALRRYDRSPAAAQQGSDSDSTAQSS